ncbi:MAG: thiamine phosphate synthase [Lentisphaeria bacterium]|nr:thiamine phosphate synthase [Lentisphaeria bacterium]
MPRRVYTTHGERLEAFRRIDVYPVVTSEFCAGRPPAEVAASLLAGGARILQIREKAMPDRPFLELLRRVRELTWDHGALLIVDDRVDAALIAQADGVHLGQDDLPLPDARRIAPELLIGVSTHNADEIRRAQAEGCSYLNIGPIFPTNTKQLAGIRFLGLDELKSLVPLVRVPFSVMGGIKYSHLAELKAAGAGRVAAVTAFTQASDPGAEAARWRAALR